MDLLPIMFNVELDKQYMTLIEIARKKLQHTW